MSKIVVREASAGDPNEATRRLAVLSDLPELGILLMSVPLPEKAQLDGLHIALNAICRKLKRHHDAGGLNEVSFASEQQQEKLSPFMIGTYM